MALPQLETDLFLTDGGLETTLVFHSGVDLPDFAAFPLLDTPEGRESLAHYFTPYLDLATRTGHGIVLDTPTWRASPDWGTRLGYDGPALAAVNADGVDFARELAASRDGLVAVLNGVLGPRGDGYVVGELMSQEEAQRYHSLQAAAFADAGAEMVTGVTMTYAAEAIGLDPGREREPGCRSWSRSPSRPTDGSRRVSRWPTRSVRSTSTPTAPRRTSW